MKTLTMKRKGVDGHAERRNLAKQIREQKRDKFLEEKRQRGGQHSPPHFVVVVGLSTGSDCSAIVKLLTDVVEQMDGGLVSKNEQFMVHASMARFKQRLSFYTPPPGNLRAALDAAKVADAVLFVTSVEDPVDEPGHVCLKCLQSQGLPESFFVCRGLNDLPHKKMVEARKQINKEIEILFPGREQKVQPLDTESDMTLILRKLTATFRKQSRPHLIAEHISFDLESDEALEGTLKVSGYLRGADLSADRLIHVTGWGTFQISQIESVLDPHPLVLNKLRGSKPLLDEDMEGVVLATQNPKFHEPLQFEFEVDMFQNEDQTWPTKEELAEAEEAAKQREITQKKRLLAKGLSEYQANWLFDDDIDEDEGSEEEEEDADRKEEKEMDEDDSDGSWESMDEADDSKSVANTETDVDDGVKFDPEAEKLQLKQLQEERMERNNPDEVEVTPDILARERFARYRGLASFRTSLWNKHEELPIDYQRIVHVGDTKKLKNRIMKTELTNSVLVGQYYTVHIKGVPKAYFDAYHPSSPLVVFGLLPFEQRMSVLHFVVRQDSSFTETLKSKSELIFQVGFRRFSASAIFSTHKPGDKQLMLRYFPQDDIAVMSVFGPVTFGPCPVVVFKEDSFGSDLQVVAKGSLLSVHPDRLIIKRVILRGHQFKMGKRKGVVRFMFFNREDIEYFKKVELRTKLNRRGRILEPLGTHGHMKCFFNGHPKSQDIVFMHLYKRVYAKWTYKEENPSQQLLTQGKEGAADGKAYEMFE